MSAAASAPRLVLASASPRRRQLLAELGLRFEVRPPEIDETPLPGESGEAMVRRLAIAKAVARLEADELVLAADTVVVIDGRLLGKPADAAEAITMLGTIAGREHEVFTGVAVARSNGSGAPAFVARVDRTAVRMRALDAGEIERYVATGDPLDKAGAYAIQGIGSTLVASIDGNYTNVVGLPIPTVDDCLREIGYDLATFRTS
ncbi:MAG: Maf family protein [Thermoanaerobaculia bacterium]